MKALKSICLASLLIIISLCFSGCQPPSVFSYDECNGTITLSPIGFNDYIKEAKWDGDTLIIEPIVNYNCAIDRIIGKSKLKGDDIILKTRSNFEFFSDLARCDCDYGTKFEFHDLEKKDYNIILKRGWKELDRLTLKSDDSVQDECSGDNTYNCYMRYILSNRFPDKIITDSYIKDITLEYMHPSDETYITIHNQKILID